METKSGESSPRYVFYALLLGLAAVLEWAMPTAGLLVAPFIAAAGLMWGRRCFAASFGAATAVLLASHLVLDGDAGIYYALEALAGVCVPAAIYYFAFSRRKPYRSALAAAAVSITAGQYFRYALVDLMAGSAPFTNLAALVREVGGVMAAGGAQTGALADNALFLETIGDMADLVPDIMLAAIIAVSMAAALFGTVLCYLLARKRTELKPMARLADWKLSKTFFFGSLILGAAAAIAGLSKLNSGTSITLALLTVALLPLAAQGVAMQVFVYCMRKRGRGFQIAVWVMSALLFPYSIMYFAVGGLMEQLMHMRRRLTEMNNNDGGPHEI